MFVRIKIVEKLLTDRWTNTCDSTLSSFSSKFFTSSIRFVIVLIIHARSARIWAMLKKILLVLGIASSIAIPPLLLDYFWDFVEDALFAALISIPFTVLTTLYLMLLLGLVLELLKNINFDGETLTLIQKNLSKYGLFVGFLATWLLALWVVATAHR